MKDTNESPTERLFQILRDTAKAPVDQLPSSEETGHSPEIELLLSSIFIESDWYGTRASTILTIQSSCASPPTCTFSERTFAENGEYVEDVKEEFEINPCFLQLNQQTLNGNGTSTWDVGVQRGHSRDVPAAELWFSSDFWQQHLRGLRLVPSINTCHQVSAAVTSQNLLWTRSPCLGNRTRACCASYQLPILLWRRTYHMKMDNNNLVCDSSPREW